MSETLVIHISAEQIRALDMAPLQELRQLSAAALLELEDSVALQLEWPRADDSTDPSPELLPLALVGCIAGSAEACWAWAAAW